MIVNKLQVYKIFPKIGGLGQIILMVNQGLHAELIGHYVILNQFLSIAICFSSGALYKWSMSSLGHEKTWSSLWTQAF